MDSLYGRIAGFIDACVGRSSDLDAVIGKMTVRIPMLEAWRKRWDTPALVAT